jgi:methylated-DNA-[protein]-cysteine S-methyltransferase
MTTTLHASRMKSPIGELTLVGDGEVLLGIYMQAHRGDPSQAHVPEASDAVLERARAELTAYFQGDLKHFTLPRGARGTPFQERVWEELTRIPYGETISYGELARRIGQPAASRAVGAANGKNPLSIVVPCHRVIGAGGDITGYAGGVERKRWLLEHERARSSSRLPFQ